MALRGYPNSREHIESLMERGVRQVMFDEYDLFDDQYEELYKVTGSSKRQEKDVIMAGIGTFQRKTEGQSPTFDAGQEAWYKQFVHNTWALGLEITEEGLEDDLYDYYTAMGGELGKAAGYTEQVEAFDLFNDLSAPVYTADGVDYTLLSTAHYRVDGGTWSNRLANAADLSIESLELALTQWRTGMVDQRGRKVSIRPEILLVGPSDEWMAHRILETERRPGGNDNDRNVVKDRRRLKIVVADFMTDDGRWFILGAKGKTGLRYNRRKALEVRRRDDPRTGNLLMVGRYRESHGASHCWGVFGSP